MGMSSRHRGTRARKHLNLADINTKRALTDRLYDCHKWSVMGCSVESFKFLKGLSTLCVQNFLRPANVRRRCLLYTKQRLRA